MTALSLDEAVRQVTETNPVFALDENDIRGTTYTVFKNIPPTLRALVQASRESQENGEADYLIYRDERWTYDEFLTDIRDVSQALTDLGLGKGDRVAIAMRNYPELLILMLAISSIGGVVVFLNAWWTTEELDYALKDSGARTVFADGPRVAHIQPLKEELGLTLIGVRDGAQLTDLSFDTMRASVQNAPWPNVDIDTDDDFSIMYSSGTTGHPKGVVQTHRGAVNAVFTWLLQSVIAPLMEDPPPDPDTPPPPRPAVLIATPLFHVTATHPCFLLSLPAGAKVALLYKWDAEEAVRIIQEEKITRFLGVPTQSADLLAAAKRMGVTLETLDYLGSGGAKRPAAQVGELEASGTFPNAKIATGWGMTETNAVGIGMVGPEYVERPGAAGRLHPPVQEMKLLNDFGQGVSQGEIGEITVKSPCNMRCYLNKPEATDEVFQDGWLRTGDLGYVDAEGYVTIVDRKKNIIIKGGENIACLDVEGALHRHPAVSEACAFSVPDERLGETVGAGVQIRSGHSVTFDELRAYLSEHIAHFKIPEFIWFQEEPLPRGATDKIDRRGLQAACLEKMNKEESK